MNEYISGGMMMVDKIDTRNNISSYRNDNDGLGIKNYFLEAQKRAAKLGQAAKKKMPPLFDNYLRDNAVAAQWHPSTSQSTASGINP